MATYISVISLGLLCLLCYSGLTQGERALDCCLKVSHTPIPLKIVKSYERQVNGQGCDIDAVVFTTKRNFNLCAPTDTLWVKELIASVDKNLKWCQARGFKARRCQGLQV